MNEVLERMLRAELESTIDKDFGRAVKSSEEAGWGVAKYVSMKLDSKGINHTGDVRFFYTKGEEVKDRTHYYQYITPRDRTRSPYWELRNHPAD